MIKLNKKLTKIDGLIIFIMLVCLIFIFYKFALINIDSCQKNPLIFSAQQLEKQFPTAEIVGTIYIMEFNKNPLIISFNSTTVYEYFP